MRISPASWLVACLGIVSGATVGIAQVVEFSTIVRRSLCQTGRATTAGQRIHCPRWSRQSRPGSRYTHKHRSVQRGRDGLRCKTPSAFWPRLDEHDTVRHRRTRAATGHGRAISSDAANLAGQAFWARAPREQRELQVYILEVAKGGPNLKEVPIDAAIANEGIKPPPPISAPPTGYQGAVIVILSRSVDGADGERLIRIA
jgi:hypothetical protein